MLRLGPLWDIIDLLRDLSKKADLIALIKAATDIYKAVKQALDDGKFDFPEDALLLLEKLQALLKVFQQESVKFKDAPALTEAEVSAANLRRLQAVCVTLFAHSLLNGRAQDAAGLATVLRKWNSRVPNTGYTVGETFALAVVGELRQRNVLQASGPDECLLATADWAGMQDHILAILSIVLVAILAIIATL